MSLGSTEVDERTRLRALAHPLRLRLLSLLTAVPLSATEVAEELGIAHGSASYHLRQLAGAGIVHEVAEPELASGHQQRRYRFDPNQALHLEQKQSRDTLHAVMLADLRRRLAAAAPGPTIADAEVWVEPAVWDEARSLADHLSRLVHDSARRPHTPGTIHVSYTSVLLTLPPDEAAS